jgi:hypothetical protein
MMPGSFFSFPNFLKTLNMALFYSKHAKQRRKQLGLTKKEVKQTVLNPCRIEPGNTHREKKFISGKHRDNKNIIVIVSVAAVPTVAWLFGGGACLVALGVTVVSCYLGRKK